MRLTANNIAYINETHHKGGKITIAVVMKSHAMSDTRFYECHHDLIGLPNAVMKYISTHKLEMIETDEKLQIVKYQYK